MRGIYLYYTNPKQKSDDIQRIYYAQMKTIKTFEFCGSIVFYHFSNSILTDDCQRYSKSINYLWHLFTFRNNPE